MVVAVSDTLADTIDVTVAADKTKTFCCATARNECSRVCNNRPCTDSCNVRCGIFNTDCGSWSCADVAGFSCTRPTPSPTKPTPTCGAAVACSSPPLGAAASTLYNGKCYSLFNTATSWFDARTACSALGGNLAAVTDECTQTQIKDNILPSVTGSNVFVGGANSPPDTAFTWVSGDTPTPDDYNNFGTTPPTTGQLCIVIDPSTGSWSTQACTSTTSYICQTTESSRSDSSGCTSASSPCPSELGDLTGARASMMYDDKCYFIYNRQSSWADKQNFCKDKLGGSLVTVSSSCLQTEIVRNLLPAATSAKVLLGGRISFPDLDFFWVGRDSRFSYTNFGPSAMENVSTTKGCLTMDKGTGLWTDTACDVDANFICQGASV